MTKLQILNSKQSKKVYELLQHFGLEKKLEGVMLQAGERIFLASRELFSIGLDKLNVNSVGVYIAEVRNGELRLSIEGSQLIGPHARKNVVELSDEEAKKWMAGEDVDKDVEGAEGFVIMKHKSDFLGCGKAKDGKILNFVPKARRVKHLKETAAAQESRTSPRR